MSDPVVRDYSFTVRLSAEERALLETLAACLRIDKSAAVRHALQISLAGCQPLPPVGRFVALPAGTPVFCITRCEGRTNDW